MKAADLIDYVASAAGVEKTAAKKAVEAVFAGIVDAAKKGEEVNLPGFGKFKVKDSPERQGRNPATGESIRIKASKKARITPVKAFKDAVLAPATAPKLKKGAYPTNEAAVKAAGTAARAPARQATARRATAKKVATTARKPAKATRRR